MINGGFSSYKNIFPGSDKELSSNTFASPNFAYNQILPWEHPSLCHSAPSPLSHHPTNWPTIKSSQLTFHRKYFHFESFQDTFIKFIKERRSTLIHTIPRLILEMIHLVTFPFRKFVIFLNKNLERKKCHAYSSISAHLKCNPFRSLVLLGGREESREWSPAKRISIDPDIKLTGWSSILLF